PLQTPLLQSPPPWQPLPLSHGPHLPPPQSTSVSPPFVLPSLHVAGTHTWLPVSQTGFDGSPQSESMKHWTHLPAPSQSLPPASMHGAPIAEGCVPHLPPLHVASMHGTG